MPRTSLMLCLLLLSVAASAQPPVMTPQRIGIAPGGFNMEPTMRFELVHTRVFRGQPDMYVLITNTNDFPVHVLNGPNSTFRCTGGERSVTSFGCGTVQEYPEDLTILGPGQKLLKRVWINCPLFKGENNIKLVLHGGYRPSERAPLDRIVSRFPELTTVINSPEDAPRHLATRARTR